MRQSEDQKIITTPVVLLARIGMVSYSTIQDVMHNQGESEPQIAEYALELAGPVETWNRYA